MRTLSSSIVLKVSAEPAGFPSWPAVDLAAHDGSARLFNDLCISETGLGERLSQWTEWLDLFLARRLATSLVLVGSIAGLIALAA